MNAVAFWGTVALAMLACDAGTTYTCNTKDKAYTTAMKSDLRNLVAAQEAFHAVHGRYASNADLQSRAMEGFFRPSTGVRVTIEYADSQRWRARATHTQLAKVGCTIDSGVEAPSCDTDVPWKEPRFSRATYSNLWVDLWLFAFTLLRRQRRLAHLARLNVGHYISQL